MHAPAHQCGLPLDRLTANMLLKYKPSVLIHPNTHAPADKAPQRQLISHWLCWGPVWARLWSTDRETDGAGLAGGVSAVLRARVHQCVYECTWLVVYVHFCIRTLSSVSLYIFRTPCCTCCTSRAAVGGYVNRPSVLGSSCRKARRQRRPQSHLQNDFSSLIIPNRTVCESCDGSYNENLFEVWCSC